MARSYPRFIYSDPKNSKSSGPFCVHLLYPRFICKIFPGNLIKLIETFDTANDKEINSALEAMKNFLIARDKTPS